jgi:hypothetical protein
MNDEFTLARDKAPLVLVLAYLANEVSCLARLLTILRLLDDGTVVQLRLGKSHFAKRM